MKMISHSEAHKACKTIGISVFDEVIAQEEAHLARQQAQTAHIEMRLNILRRLRREFFPPRPKRRLPGPKPERLKLHGPWEETVKRALNSPRFCACCDGDKS